MTDLDDALHALAAAEHEQEDVHVALHEAELRRMAATDRVKDARMAVEVALHQRKEQLTAA